MSEEIIIDGVDVAGCEYRSDTHNTLLADGKIMKFEDYCHITNDGCYGVNCYYKQLKRLQAENEELNEKVKTLDKMTGIYSARLCKKYKQALEEIRGILCKGRTFYDGYFENENLSRTDKAIKVISEVLDD